MKIPKAIKFKPLEIGGIDTSLERFKEAPDCELTECPANKLWRCIRIGDCLLLSIEKPATGAMK